MAISSAALKVAAKVAFSIITDEDSRRKAITICVAPIAAIVLLVSLTVYIVTMPFAWLSNFFLGDQFNFAQNFRIEHGYDQLINPTDESYLESAGLNYSGVSFTDGATEVHYYNQLDSRWKDLPYGVTSTIGQAGCAPTSLAIVLSSLTNQIIDPLQMSSWAYENGYLCEGSGSYHSLIPNGGRHFGLTVEGCSVKEPQRIVDALSSGKLVIAIMGKGHFTTRGHFLVMRDVTADGKILVADPASKSKSEREWDLQIFLNEARKGAAAGGPFWILSYP
jgi:hypothetical protein